MIKTKSYLISELKRFQSGSGSDAIRLFADRIITRTGTCDACKKQNTDTATMQCETENKISWIHVCFDCYYEFNNVISDEQTKFSLLSQNGKFI